MISTPAAVGATDQADAPGLVELDAADLADLYAWPTERNTLVMVLTYAGRRDAGGASVYDASALYTIHIDNTADPAERQDWNANDNDNESDLRIDVRFGQNGLGEWGVQLNGVPGAADVTFDGPVQTEIDNGSARVLAGQFDDPSFVDIDGFESTLALLSDDAYPVDIDFAGVQEGMPADGFAGTNAMAIVVEVDLATALAGNPHGYLQLWATSGVL